jgi:uncharacterized protein (TIGR02246 family)
MMTDDNTERSPLAVRSLYGGVLDAWNRRSAEEMAAPFAEQCLLIGFDGSTMYSRAEIARAMAAVFADHATGAYVGKVRSVQVVAPGVVLLLAATGVVPAGAADLNPALNAWQTVVAQQQGDGWQIVQMQTTPAQFHGRPELVAQLTEELRAWRGGEERYE